MRQWATSRRGPASSTNAPYEKIFDMGRSVVRLGARAA
jgi:hypothetical protein